MGAGPCPDEALLAGFIDQALDADQREAVERHIDGCPACRGVVAELIRAAAPDSGEDDEALLGAFAAERRLAQISPVPEGATVGRFTILSRVASGGMGVVYAARDPKLDRKVALKLLRADVAQGAPGNEARERMLREAKAMARLDHPNVIGVHDVGTIGDDVFLAMEFVDGTTLRGWVNERPRSWREILFVYRQAGLGLAAAHAAGLVHRDFKPDNALVGKDGRCRVTDFGLVRSMSNPWPTLTPPPLPVGGKVSLVDALTRASELLGTPGYMAPEQLDGRPADERSDQFSFCVSLFEALFGARPFGGKTVEELRSQIRSQPPAFPPRSRVPSAVRKVLLRGLSASPFDRYRSMDALLADVDRSRAAATRTRIAAGSAVALGLGLAAAAGFLSSRPSCSDPQDAALWSAAARDRLRAAFAPSGAGGWARLDAALSAWTADLVAARKRACGAPSAMRSACLDARRQEASALVEVLGSGPGARARAADAVWALPSLSRCELPAVQLVVPPPEDLQARAELERARGQVAGAKAEGAAGDVEKARELADRAVVEARRTAYPPVLAQALLAGGDVARRQRAWPEAEASFDEAVVVAEAARDDEAVARATIALAEVVGLRLGRMADAARLQRAAQAKLERLGAPGELEAMLAEVSGAIALAEGRLDDAQAQLERAVEFRGQLPGAGRELAFRPLGDLATVMSRRGRAEEALAERSRALALARAALGPEHPEVAAQEIAASYELCAAGRAPDAVEAAAHAVQVLGGGRVQPSPQDAAAFDEASRAVAAANACAAAHPSPATRVDGPPPGH